MSKKANPTLIGLFTLVGLLIAAAGTVFLGAGKYFEDTSHILVYFEKSVNGLQVGSDVRFSGVRIGQVKYIKVLVDQENNRKIIPVLLQLGEKELRAVGSTTGQPIDFSTLEGVEKAVKEGLRARMKQQSLLTGQLYVEFDVVPNTEGFIYQSQKHSDVPAVPTIATEMDELIAGIADGLKKINALDLDGVITELKEILTSTKAQISELDVKTINDNLVHITDSMKQFTESEQLTRALTNLDKVLVELQELSTKVNENADPLLEDLNEMMETANKSLAEIESAAREVADTVNPQGPVMMRLQNVLEEADRAARSIKELANELKRHPNSLILGKEQKP